MIWSSRRSILRHKCSSSSQCLRRQEYFRYSVDPYHSFFATCLLWQRSVVTAYWTHDHLPLKGLPLSATVVLNFNFLVTSYSFSKKVCFILKFRLKYHLTKNINYFTISLTCSCLSTRNKKYIHENVFSKKRSDFKDQLFFGCRFFPLLWDAHHLRLLTFGYFKRISMTL